MEPNNIKYDQFKDENGNNLLMGSIINHHKEIVTYILNNDLVDINAINMDGRTALSFLMQQIQWEDQIEILKLFLDCKDINLDIKDKMNKIFIDFMDLDILEHKKIMSIFKIIKNAKYSLKSNTLIDMILLNRNYFSKQESLDVFEIIWDHKVISCCNHNFLYYFTQAKVSLGIKYYFLKICQKNRELVFSEYLVELFYEMVILESLLQNLYEEIIETIKLLFNFGLDITKISGKNLKWIYSKIKRYEFLTYLKSRGLPNDYEFMIEILAKEEKYDDIEKLLTKIPSDQINKIFDSINLLSFSTIKYYLDLENKIINLLKIFIKYKYDINAQDENNKSLLHLAFIKKYYHLCNFLLDNGININLINDKNNTPLHLMLGNHYLNSDEKTKLVKLIVKIIELKPDINILNNDNNSYLHLMIYRKIYKIALIFLESQEIDINIVNNVDI